MAQPDNPLFEFFYSAFCLVGKNQVQVCRLCSMCQVHKPGVPHGPASQQKLGPVDNVANDAQLLGWPKNLMTGQKGDPASDRKA